MLELPVNVTLAASPRSAASLSSSAFSGPSPTIESCIREIRQQELEGVNQVCHTLPLHESSYEKDRRMLV